MPQMSGLEVQSRLGKISPSTRVIIFTGKDDPLVRSTALNAGASAFLTKPFDDEELMLREVNASKYGLSGSLWTRDLARALRIARRVESGVLSINSNSIVHVEAPFGGFKQSGIGRDLGTAAMEGYTELKNVYVAT